jgi:hypothetical protein
MHKSSDQTGSIPLKIVILIIVGLLVVGGLGYAGWHVYDNHRTKKAAPSVAAQQHQSDSTTPKDHQTTASQVIYSPDKKVQLTLPSTWHVVDTPKNVQVISSVSSSKGCFGPQDTNGCVYSAVLQPTGLSADQAKASNAMWTLQVEKNGSPLKQIAQARIGAPANSGNLTTVNGAQAFITKVQVGTFNPDGVIDMYAFLQKGGYTAMFYNRTKDISHGSHPDSEDYTAYETGFMDIISSTKLNF